MNSRTRIDGRGSRLLGLLFFLNGLALNPWSLGRLLAPDRHLEGTTNLAVIFVAQALSVGLGVWLYRRRPALPPFLAAVAALALASIAALFTYGTVLAFQPPRWQAADIPMVERLELVARDTTFYKLEAERRTWQYRLESTGLTGAADEPERQMKDALYELQRGETETAIERLREIRLRAEGGEEISQTLLESVSETLAVAYLRLGEQQNCIDRHTPYACYLPLPRAGVHQLPEGSRAAIDELKAILAAHPDDLGSRWLLNLAYMTLGTHPGDVPAQWLIPAEVFRSEGFVPRFRDAAPSLGVDVLSLSGGSILEDFDSDGYLDLMVSGTGLDEQLRYFRNQADGTFAERTEQAGLVGQLGGLNLVQADYNNDGNADVLVLRGGWMTFDSGDGNHPNSLLRNDGNGTFTDVTEEAGILSFHPTQTAAWGDYDNDGFVDLFIGNESWENQAHPPELFRNDGDGTFTEVADEVGVAAAAGYIKGAAWGDYDNDGLLDLYVSRIGRANALLRNRGPSASGWSFEDVTQTAGVAEPRFSFPTWFWDYDNDGWLDLFVAGFGGNFSEGSSAYGDGDDSVDRKVLSDVAASYLGKKPQFSESSRLYRNRRDGTFEDVTSESRLDRVLYTMGANFGDVDNDGFEDVYFGTGTASYRSLMPNRLFRSDGGRVFQDVTTAAGVGHLQKGHGISFGDVDNDGDVDLYAEMGGWFAGDAYWNALYENPGGANHWITLRLTGTRSNRLAVGARIALVVNSAGQRREIHRVVSSGGSFGASSFQQEIGLGEASEIERVVVFWPTTGLRQVFENVPMDRIYEIVEGRAELTVASSAAIELAIHQDEELQHLHEKGTP